MDLFLHICHSKILYISGRSKPLPYQYKIGRAKKYPLLFLYYYGKIDLYYIRKGIF